MNSCVVLTGVPGIGKSAVGRRLAVRRNNVLYRSAGDKVREIVASRAQSHEDVRISLDAVVTPDVIAQAKRELIEEVRALSDQYVVLLDSHTATGTSYGVRATPDNVDRMRELGVLAFIHLVASAESILIRRNDDGMNPRFGSTKADVELQQQVLLALTTVYAQQLGVPAFFVLADSELEEVVGSVSNVLDRALEWQGSV